MLENDKDTLLKVDYRQCIRKGIDLIMSFLMKNVQAKRTCQGVRLLCLSECN